MCWREVFDAKKYCFLSLLVVILLLLQIVQLVTPPAFLDEMMASPRFGRYLHRFLYDNVTAAVAAAGNITVGGGEGGESGEGGGGNATVEV